MLKSLLISQYQNIDESLYIKNDQPNLPRQKYDFIIYNVKPRQNINGSKLMIYEQDIINLQKYQGLKKLFNCVQEFTSYIRLGKIVSVRQNGTIDILAQNQIEGKTANLIHSMKLQKIKQLDIKELSSILDMSFKNQEKIESLQMRQALFLLTKKITQMSEQLDKYSNQKHMNAVQISVNNVNNIEPQKQAGMKIPQIQQMKQMMKTRTTRILLEMENHKTNMYEQINRMRSQITRAGDRSTKNINYQIQSIKQKIKQLQENASKKEVTKVDQTQQPDQVERPYQRGEERRTRGEDRQQRMNCTRDDRREYSRDYRRDDRRVERGQREQKRNDRRVEKGDRRHDRRDDRVQRVQREQRGQRGQREQRRDDRRDGTYGRDYQRDRRVENTRDQRRYNRREGKENQTRAEGFNARGSRYDRPETNYNRREQRNDWGRFGGRDGRNNRDGRQQYGRRNRNHNDFRQLPRTGYNPNMGSMRPMMYPPMNRPLGSIPMGYPFPPPGSTIGMPAMSMLPMGMMPMSPPMMPPMVPPMMPPMMPLMSMMPGGPVYKKVNQIQKQSGKFNLKAKVVELKQLPYNKTIIVLGDETGIVSFYSQSKAVVNVDSIIELRNVQPYQYDGRLQIGLSKTMPFGAFYPTPQVNMQINRNVNISEKKQDRPQEEQW